MSIDYSEIAIDYDKVPFRTYFQSDDLLIKFSQDKDYITVLDLACGTGNYISKHKKIIQNASFIGMDASNAMIQHAKMKGIKSLVLADVDQGIPLNSQTIDYVACRYAFHHFVNKSYVIFEIARVLKQGGGLYMHNIDPYSNNNWWVYALFPEVISEDLERFWAREKLMLHLQNVGLSVSYVVNNGTEIMYKSDILDRLRSKDTSQLHMVDQSLYLDRLRDVESWPDSRCIKGDYSFLTMYGKKLT